MKGEWTSAGWLVGEASTSSSPWRPHTRCSQATPVHPRPPPFPSLPPFVHSPFLSPSCPHSPHLHDDHPGRAEVHHGARDDHEAVEAVRAQVGADDAHEGYLAIKVELQRDGLLDLFHDLTAREEGGGGGGDGNNPYGR